MSLFRDGKQGHVKAVLHRVQRDRVRPSWTDDNVFRISNHDRVAEVRAATRNSCRIGRSSLQSEPKAVNLEHTPVDCARNRQPDACRKLLSVVNAQSVASSDVNRRNRVPRTSRERCSDAHDLRDVLGGNARRNRITVVVVGECFLDRPHRHNGAAVKRVLDLRNRHRVVQRLPVQPDVVERRAAQVQHRTELASRAPAQNGRRHPRDRVDYRTPRLRQTDVEHEHRARRQDAAETGDRNVRERHSEESADRQHQRAH